MAKTPAKESKIGKGVDKPTPTPPADKDGDKTPPSRTPKDQFPIPEDKFETWPEDFDAKKHKPLKRTEFKDESVWLFHRADELEARAKTYRTQGENWKKLGSIKNRAKATKLIKLTSEIAKLRLSLIADGCKQAEIDELLPPAPDAPAATEAAPATA